MPRLVHEMLSASARRDPDKTAVIAGDRSHTFAEIDRWSNRIAQALCQAGIQRGDRVAVFMENCAELVASVFGILKAGGVFVMINPTAKPKKLAYILNDCGVRGLIAQPKVADVVAASVPQVPTITTYVWTAPCGENAPKGSSFAELSERSDAAAPDAGVIDMDLCMILYTSP